jgi:hypothetical protein
MQGHLRRARLRNLGRLTVSAALVAWRHFFVAPLASRTTQYAPRARRSRRLASGLP